MADQTKKDLNIKLWAQALTGTQKSAYGIAADIYLASQETSCVMQANYGSATYLTGAIKKADFNGDVLCIRPGVLIGADSNNVYGYKYFYCP